MSRVLNEITPLSEKDCFYIVERHKSEFTYPVHQHKEFELNFIEHGEGVRRIVGDSVETIGDYDLVLIGGENLEHAWEQGTCSKKDIREITIQFSPDIFSGSLLAKNQFNSIRKMLVRAEHGLSFSHQAVMKVYHLLDTISTEQERFTQFLSFLSLLNQLSQDEDARVLASGSFSGTDKPVESRRVQKVKKYIDEHFTGEIRQGDLADMVGMSPSAFSRFFKLRTGKTLSDYIIDIRLGHAARQLVDTTKNISEICYGCGFNNLSNFNRVFKSKRGVTPREFRSMYKKSKVIV
ncbi:MAG: helix-turn-helix domain-containing protein [Bacteroidales bacterium]|nr:helix-turn-helix domain-containing protein [Bacteroidales bacterium]MBQ9172611.1 helix-turn-helix domain-containing protein [Bacteroidales bacterium]MBR1436307.1 helix-turn-helix domain-containing protein [Bacteroidales bacterium]MBR6415526.1 helix-turn-helix domain-containing protein [Bacteroidales bacterium]